MKYYQASLFQYTLSWEIVELVTQLQKDLQYPNSENSNDEKQYIQRFEIQLNKLLK